MDFSTLIIIVIVFAALGAVGSILFWAGIAYFGFKAAQGYQQELDSIMQNYAATVSQLKSSHGGAIPPAAQQQLFNHYLQAQNQISHFDRLSRERQDLVRSDMLSQASSAGIDVSGW